MSKRIPTTVYNGSEYMIINGECYRRCGSYGNRTSYVSQLWLVSDESTRGIVAMQLATVGDGEIETPLSKQDVM